MRAEEESRLLNTGEELRDESSELVKLEERGLGAGMSSGGRAFAQAIVGVAGRIGEAAV